MNYSLVLFMNFLLKTGTSKEIFKNVFIKILSKLHSMKVPLSFRLENHWNDLKERMACISASFA